MLRLLEPGFCICVLLPVLLPGIISEPCKKPTVGFANPVGVAGQILLLFPAWCVGDLVPFVINTTHLGLKLLPLTNGREVLAF